MIAHFGKEPDQVEKTTFKGKRVVYLSWGPMPMNLVLASGSVQLWFHRHRLQRYGVYPGGWNMYMPDQEKLPKLSDLLPWLVEVEEAGEVLKPCYANLMPQGMHARTVHWLIGDVDVSVCAIYSYEAMVFDSASGTKVRRTVKPDRGNLRVMWFGILEKGFDKAGTIDSVAPPDHEGEHEGAEDSATP
jgi:hypothetical protein